MQDRGDLCGAYGSFLQERACAVAGAFPAVLVVRDPGGPQVAFIDRLSDFQLYNRDSYAQCKLCSTRSDSTGAVPGMVPVASQRQVLWLSLLSCKHC